MFAIHFSIVIPCACGIRFAYRHIALDLVFSERKMCRTESAQPHVEHIKPNKI